MIIWLWESGFCFVGLERKFAETNDDTVHSTQVLGRSCLLLSEECQNPQLIKVSS